MVFFIYKFLGGIKCIKTEKPNYNEIIFSEEQLNDIKESYINGESSVKIGKRYNCDHHVILKFLHKMNVNVDQKRFVRKYSLDENYFDNIDTPNKAYILGFLYADGHNSIDKSTVTMSLQEEDKKILEDIRKEIKSERQLEFINRSDMHYGGYNYKNQYRLLMFSKHMCKSLEKNGMVQNKSLVLEFPDISEDLYSHFIRGCFDGDGTIGKNDGYFGLVSTKQFVKAVDEIFKKELGVIHSKIVESPCKNGITHELRYCRKSETKLIFDWLYKDAELYLDRKYEKYLKIHCKKIA